ncbi:hypothetical protein WJX81_007753 [Elliptochloris bilobata]|uniref:ATP phosphoribosyltransferase n=1 Tax=Elliptochloris bilobata TaxID=381761 RepID=A0AAW1QYY4_9CHLO
MTAPGTERAVRRRFISDPRPRSAAWYVADAPLQGMADLLSCRAKRAHPQRPSSRRSSLDAVGAHRAAKGAHGTCPLKPEYKLASTEPPPSPSPSAPLPKQQRHWELEQVPACRTPQPRDLALDCSDIAGAAAKRPRRGGPPAGEGASAAPTPRRAGRATNFVADIERVAAQPAPLRWARDAAKAASERALRAGSAAAELRGALREGAVDAPALWLALRGRDRDSSGRLTAAEFATALTAVRVSVPAAEAWQLGQLADAAPVDVRQAERTTLRMAIPSKGRMAEDTLQLLKECQLNVYKPNPRQYIATISQMPGLEVWFQRASDVVRKLMYGDVDIGIVGADMFAEIANGDPSLVVLHDALDFGKCHLALGLPTSGKFADVNSLEELRSMPDWTAKTPLRVVTGYHNVARRFFERAGFRHVTLLSADGALEAAPLMGCADIILDLVSTGVTLRENNLKEVVGGRIMDSQGVLVASRAALLQRPGLLDLVHELIERLEAHLTAELYYSVVANMRGDSPADVAERVLACPGLQGLQGPTVSPVFSRDGSNTFSATICVPKARLYASVKELRLVGGSGVLVLPMTYIFDEEPMRWRRLLEELGIPDYMPSSNGVS